MGTIPSERALAHRTVYNREAEEEEPNHTKILKRKGLSKVKLDWTTDSDARPLS